MNELLKTTLATLVTFAVIVASWTAAIKIFEVPTYLLPMPAEIAWEFWRGWTGGIFPINAWATLKGALSGFLIGTTLGVLVGIIVSEIRVARLAFYPIIVTIQSMPTVAIAPLIIVYLGVGLASKIVTVALLCFFPVFVNTVAGMRSADQDLLDLYRAASATRMRTVLDVRLPFAANHIMSSLQVAIVLSLVGCVVSELVAARAGLGYIIALYANELKPAIMFASVISLAIMGALLGSLVMFLHRRVVFWVK